MKRVLFSFFLFLLIEGYCEPFDFHLDAESALLMNAETGAILYEKNAHVPAFPASLTKMATALFVLENASSLDHPVTVSKEAIISVDPSKKEDHPPYCLEAGGAGIGIKQGEVLPLKSLLYGLMIASGNDAANVIAESMSGSIYNFMDDLNAYLQTVGCKNTFFCNPHGLHHPQHVTTAYDLAILARRGLEDPVFRQIVSTERFQLSKTNKQSEKELKQTNQLLRRDKKYYYPYALGVKTGFTAAAKYNLTTAAKKGDRYLIAVVMGCKTQERRYQDVIKMFETAFAEKKQKRCIVSKEKVFSLELKGTKKMLKSSLKNDLAIEFYPSEEPKVKAFIHWDEFTLPIKKDQKVGEVRVVSNDQEILKKAPLYAEEDISKTFVSNLKGFFGLD